MGNYESTPAATEVVEQQPTAEVVELQTSKPMTQDEFLKTMEEIVNIEYSKMQDELTTSANKSIDKAKVEVRKLYYCVLILNDRLLYLLCIRLML